MKKILLLLAFATYLFSCKDTATSTQRTVDDDTLTAAEWAALDTISRADVVKMQKFYYDSITKTNSNIINTIYFDSIGRFRSVVNTNKAIYIIAGAHLIPSLNIKRGDLATIIGVRNNNGKIKFYHFNSIFSESAMGTSRGTDVCPPPEPPCPLPEDEIQ